MVVGESIGQTDVAIIGAGPGGYIAAIHLAELGKRVTIIDREAVGGVCLHHGCIPTKAMIHAAEFYHEVEQANRFGVSVENLKIDFPKLQSWKKKIVDNLDNGIRRLLQHHQIQLLQANAFFETSYKLCLRPVTGTSLDINALEFHQCIIATGSKERLLPNVPIDGQKIITSNEILEIGSLPKSLLVIGGGYIGIEISQMLAKLGVEVHLVESLPSILNLLDEEFSQVVQKQLEKLNARIYVSSQVLQSRIEGDQVRTTLQTPNGNQNIVTDKVLIAIGRVPNTEELQIRNTHVKTDAKGYILTNNQMRTDDQRIYAIGDVRGGIMLAHKAAFEAKIAAEAICGKKSIFDNYIPYAIFSDPEIAGVGLTEKEAKEKNIQYKVTRFNSTNLAKVQISGCANAFYKILYDLQKNILGVHIVGPRSSDLIGQAVLAMEMGATVEDLSLIIYSHPSIVEGYGEVSELAMGYPTNTF